MRTGFFTCTSPSGWPRSLGGATPTYTRRVRAHDDCSPHVARWPEDPDAAGPLGGTYEIVYNEARDGGEKGVKQHFLLGFKHIDFLNILDVNVYKFAEKSTKTMNWGSPLPLNHHKRS